MERRLQQFRERNLCADMKSIFDNNFQIFEYYVREWSVEINCLRIDFGQLITNIYLNYTVADPEEGPWGPLTPPLKLTLEGLMTPASYLSVFVAIVIWFNDCTCCFDVSTAKRVFRLA